MDVTSYNKTEKYTLQHFEQCTLRQLISIVRQHMKFAVKNLNKKTKEEIALEMYTFHNKRLQELYTTGEEEKEKENRECEKKIDNDDIKEDNTLQKFSDFITDKFQKIDHYKIDNKWWWCGNEVAKLFGYKDYKTIIYRLKCPKIKYENMVDLSIGIVSMLQPSTIFIEKRGIFQLILNSNMPLAIQFQDLLIDDIIPSILQHGMYISPSITSQQIENLQKQLEIEKQKTEQLQLQLEHIPSLQLTDVQENQLKNMKKVKKSYIYIITCKFYASNKLFKVGRSNNTSSRLNTLNTPMITDKLHFYICCKFECCDAFNTEKIIHELIKTFLFEKEFYKIAYLKLKEIVELCCYGINNVYDKLLELDHILDDNTIPEELILTTTKKEDDNTIFKKINTITNYYT